MKIKTGSKTEKILKIAIAIGTVLIPAALWYLWLRTTGCDILKSHPTISDELNYWRVMYSFSERGFDFGTGGGFINYEPEWGHFGCHGLAPFLAWGWYALIASWSWASLVEANFVIFTAAVLIFVLLVHDNTVNMLFSAAVLLCFPYVFLYFCSSMMEIPCAATAVICAGLYIKYRRTEKKGWLCAALAVVVYFTGLRYSHIMLAFPMLWELCDRKLSKKTAVIMLCYAVAALLLFKLYYKFIARYPDWILVAVENGSFSEKLTVLLQNIGTNLKLYFTLEEHQTIEFFQRILLLVLAPALWLIAARKKDGGLYFALGLLAFGTVAFNIVCYDIGYQKEFRMMGPVLLFIVLVLVNETDKLYLMKSAVTAVVAAGLVIALVQIRGYGQRQEYNMFFMLDRFSELHDMSEEIGKYFDDEAASAAIKVTDTFETVAYIPPQIGVQWVYTDEDLEKCRTDYIISITEDSIIPDNYVLVGEPQYMYRIYKKTGD